MRQTKHRLPASLAAMALLGGLLLPLGPAAAQSSTSTTTTTAPSASQAGKSAKRYEEPGAGAMILDGLIVRPLSLASTVVGGVIYVVTLPFSAIGGNAGQAGETLVLRPAEYTFSRCLGCFREGR